MNQSFELPVEQVFAQGSQAQAICYTTREHQRLGRGLPGQVRRAGARGMSAIGKLLRPSQRRRHRRLGRPGQD